MTRLIDGFRRYPAAMLLGVLLLAVGLMPSLVLRAQPSWAVTGGSTTGLLGSGGIVVGYGAPGASLLRVSRTQLTHANVTSLLTTAITVVPAQGAGTLTEVLGGLMVFDRTAAYTETGGNDNWRLYYRTSSDEVASNTIETTGFVDAAGDAIIRFGPLPPDTVITGTELSNAAIVLSALNDGNYNNLGGGNAANTVTIHVLYRVIRTEL